MLPPLDPPASLELFATSANGTLTYLYLHNGRWTAPTALGVLAASPAVPVMR